MNKHLLASIVGGASLLFGTMASATTFEPKTFNEMVSQASACVIADVQSSETIRRDGAIVTLTTFKVRKAAFGNVGQTITVETPGGSAKIGRLSVSEVVAGSPRFFTGREALMLLSDAPSGNFSVVGLSEGVFAVDETPTGNGVVYLPVDAGGAVSVDEAVDIVRDQRANPSTTNVDR